MKNRMAVAVFFLMVLNIVTPAALWAAATVATDSVFYVYADKSDRRNHYIPSGWMGDYGDIKISDGDTTDPADGKTDIKIVYTAKSAQGANWVGMFWQHPANNWGERDGGYDLSKYHKLTFWARADKAAHVSEFKMGGITGTFMDSDSASIGPVDVTPKWTKYSIDLSGKDLRHIIGAFCWSASRDDNPDGFTIYFDEIRFEP